ncbi:MAG: 7-carboxy-7-deazaguanine synthase [Fimbriimonadaceae bacterium]|nr:7-carboxy-7-deazaguanine synthase [Fimbriimonadaceae bacterium]
MAAASELKRIEKLRIAEIFASIQGEGQWLGTPSTFVRVSGCNLRCGWCDTPYASWEPEGPTIGLPEILAEVDRLGTKHVVLTGGEPLLFDAIVPLAEALRKRGKVITVETAGTVFRELRCDLMSISPKLAGSAPDESTGWRERHESTRTNLEVLDRLIAGYPHQLKFVVNPEGPDELPEILSLLERLPSLSDSSPILLMAEGRDVETIHRRERLLVPVCMKHGFRLTPRYQIDLFGDTRGT